jgi:hypothetical protein
VSGRFQGFTARRAEPALHHAANSLHICEQNGIGDFDLAFAYEALARAYAIDGNNSKVKEFRELALVAAENIKDKGDKKYFLSELTSIKM